MVNNFPFHQEIIENKKVRTFNQDVDDDELKWHRDREDRIVEIVQNEDWYLQMDNELPTKLIVGEKYYIPKGIYHRVIKGIGSLKVIINEF